MHEDQKLPQPAEAVETAPGVVDLAIVILNYNTAALLRGCLHSVLASRTTMQMRVCVVDNASTDGSAVMVREEFPDVHLIVNRHNVGYSAGNNVGLRWFGFGGRGVETPRYALLLNPDTVTPPDSLERMVRFMDEHVAAGAAGPRVRRPDGSLDRACRRSFPTPAISFYRMIGLSRAFPRSRRFNAYNLEYLPEDAVHPVDAVVGAFMMVRGQAIEQAGLLDEEFFMYGEDLDWAKRIKDAGWEIWYNGQTAITHVKEAASSQSVKSRIDFYEAMWIFYRKHYREQTGWLLDKLILLGVTGKGSADVGRHLWRFCRTSGRPATTRAGAGSPHRDWPPATSV